MCNYNWIHEVCRRFSLAMGWPLRFRPAQARMPEGEDDTRNGLSPRWTFTLYSGTQMVGSLLLSRTTGRPLDASYLRACEMADVLAGILARALTQGPASGCEEACASSSHASTDPPSQPWDEEIDQILNGLLRLTRHRCAAVFIMDPESKLLRLRGCRSIDQASIPMSTRDPAGSCPDARALRDGSWTISRREDPEGQWLPADMGIGHCQAIGAPGNHLGTLWVFDRRAAGIGHRGHHAIDSAATRLMRPLEQALMRQEQAAQEQLRSELRVASECYASSDIVHTPVDTWCDVMGRVQSHRDVGGDLCEILPLDDDRLLFAVGDAAGHSIPAAMVMATVRGALRALASLDDDARLSVAQVMDRINRSLYGIVQSHQFMTLVLGLLDRKQMTFSYANAGHPAPLLMRQGEISPLDAHGILLGVLPETTYVETQVLVRPGDLIVIYSDGISEASGRVGQMFRTSGIVGTLRECIDMSASAVIDAVWRRLEAHLCGEASRDDRTMLAVRLARSLRKLDFLWDRSTSSAAQVGL